VSIESNVATRKAALEFTRDDAQKAGESWGFNCGPGALCAVLGMTPDEIRPHLLDFERKHYTNPTLMTDILKGLGVKFRQTYRGDYPTNSSYHWPEFGLVRIQWGGPWTQPGVPMRVRYRHTHWVGCQSKAGRYGMMFDINAMCAGGWIPFNEWALQLTPWLIKQCEPKASGEWWPTHCLEIGGKRPCD